ncbi:hypothetical protein DBR45_14545, partial [Pseudomonas sp. HMWF031]
MLHNELKNAEPTTSYSLAGAGKSITDRNWGYPPFNRISFQHLQSLFRTARIRRDADKKQSIPIRSRAILAEPFYNAEGQICGTYEDMVKITNTDALLVMKEGNLILEHYTNGMDVDSLHLINSVTKTFTGMLAGILVSEGKLSPDALITELVPELAGTDAWKGTTLRHCLDMTANVDYIEDYG